MAKILDARGLSCPQPVILAVKAAGENEFPFEVRVDTVVARDNVRRAMESSGHAVQVTGEGDEFRLIVGGTITTP